MYLKGQIVSIKEPNSEWSDIEKGIKSPQNPNIRFAVKTLAIAKPKLKHSVTKENRLVVIKKNNRDFVDVAPNYDPGE